jgi:hypothetical protein
MGTGIALLRATVTLAVEAEEIWVEAKAPVMTRAAAATRMMLFMGIYLEKFTDVAKFFAGQIS